MKSISLLLCALAACSVSMSWATGEEPASAQTDTIGALTYRLSDGSDTWPEAKRAKITQAMDEAIALYNRYAPFKKALRVSYNPSVPTADGNYNGHIRFGGTINARIALHEIAHTLGIGTTRQWLKKIEKGRWTGARTTVLLKGFDGARAILRADRQHFWPYGLNYDREDGATNRIRHVLMVERLCREMELPVFEADNQRTGD